MEIYMKLGKLAVIILLVLACYGCSKSSEKLDINDIEAEDVQYLTAFVSTEEESDSIVVVDQDGVQEFLNLLQGIEVVKKLEQTTREKASYYEYELTLTSGETYRLIDYQEKIKVIDTEEKTNWYEISSNTWDGLSDLWKKYYTETTDIITPNLNPNEVLAKKPVIYLYPTKTTEISVKLDLKGKLTYTYPSYENGWSVVANPDGSLRTLADGKQYSYLFWEGLSDIAYEMNEGFVVKGADTTKFLEEKLSYLGLSSKEYNDFIVYWAPEMLENKYNLITFQEKAYTDSAKLTITPEPNSMLRIFMVYQPLEEYIDIPEPQLTSWERTGYSVVEWGGARVIE
jgi:hypothetical protein